MIEIEFCSTEWCFLYGAPDLREGGRMWRPGRADTYGRTDDMGRYFLSLTVGRDKNGNAMVERDLEQSLVYPERLFVWGKRKVEQPRSKWMPLEHMKVLWVVDKLRLGCKGFWDECIVKNGWGPEGYTWYNALRAEPSIGKRWHDVLELERRGDLPAGWDLEFTSGCQHAILYIEE